MVALNAWNVALKAKTEYMMTLNAKLTNGSKCQTVNDDSEHQTKDMMALNVELKNMEALNAKSTNGSECQTVNDDSER